MRQKLGQHFLQNAKVLRTIVKTLDIKNRDFVIEIGPGHGELTDLLIEQAEKNMGVQISAIEKDTELVELLKKKFSGNKTIKIVRGDAVLILPSLIKNVSVKIVGNIPYYISGALLRKLSELKHKPQIAVLLLQREVAWRIADKPPKMNLLAASVQVWAEPQIICHIPREDFWPHPEVDSALIMLKVKNDNSIPAGYYAFIRALFKQPRKTILNNLRGGFSKSKNELIELMLGAGIEPNDRPQNLTVGQIMSLARIF